MMDEEYEWSLEVYCRDAATVDAVEDAYRTRRVQDDDLVIVVSECCTRDGILQIIAEIEAMPGVTDVMCDSDRDAPIEMDMDRSWN